MSGILLPTHLAKLAEEAVSFTFDDIEQPLSVSESVKLGQLSARIADLKSRKAAQPALDPETAVLEEKIARLEQRRARLLNEGARGMTAIELEGRAVEDGAGGSRSGDLAAAESVVQKRAERYAAKAFPRFRISRRGGHGPLR